MEKESFISLKGVSKIYKLGETEIRALDDVTFTVKKGEFVIFQGPSGSGKTTLLNIIGGIDFPTSGEVFIDGKDISRLNEGKLTDYRAKYVGWVFQFFNLIPSLTALENVALALELIGETKEMYKKARKALEIVGLGDKENKFPAQLSGGEQQRVAIARAIVKKPRIVLADEPTGNLDHVTGTRVMEIFKDLTKHENITVLVVTHDLSLTSFADRVFELRDGKIAKELMGGM